VCRWGSGSVFTYSTSSRYTTSNDRCLSQFISLCRAYRDARQKIEGIAICTFIFFNKTSSKI
jgi:hypothetical protein